MKKLFITLTIVLFSSFSAYGYNFKSCQAKSKTFMQKVGNSWAVAIAPDALLYHSSSGAPKGFRVIKSDPFIGLYLLKEPSNKMRQRIDANNSSPFGYISFKEITPTNLQEEMGSFTPTQNVSGKIDKRQTSPIDYARLNVPTLKNSVIGTVCDQLYGLGIASSDKKIAQMLGISNTEGNRGEFLEVYYINRFLNQDKPYYGNVGIRLKNQAKPAVVDLVDPFYPDNPFKSGDVITSINGVPISDSSSFYRVVFDLPQNSHAPITVLREGREVPLVAQVEARWGGLLLPENLFRRIGLSVSPNFVIQEVLPSAKGEIKKLRKGDKVIKVNNELVPSGERGIIELMGRYPTQEQTWLVQRNNFQFFMRVNTSPNVPDNPQSRSSNVNKSEYGDSIINFDVKAFQNGENNATRQRDPGGFGEEIMDLDVNSFKPQNKDNQNPSQQNEGNAPNDSLDGIFNEAPSLPPRPRT